MASKAKVSGRFHRCLKDNGCYVPHSNSDELQMSEGVSRCRQMSLDERRRRRSMIRIASPSGKYADRGSRLALRGRAK